MTSIRWLIILVLVVLYCVVIVAALHPHVSQAYREYFIDSTSSDYDPPHYNATPEQGIALNREELPQWVHAVRGFALHHDEGGLEAGRFTDSGLGVTPGLTFNRRFDGEVCLDLVAYGVPWIVGQPIGVRIGDQEQVFRLNPGGFSHYQLQFAELRGADHLDFLLSKDIPAVVERQHEQADPRRLGVNIYSLKLLPGDCPSAQNNAGGR